MALKESLSYAVGTSPGRWQGLLRRSALARAVRGSNSIEGYSVSVDDAILRCGEGEQAIDANEESVLAVRGYQMAMTYVAAVGQRSGCFSYSEALIRSLQFMMIQHDQTKAPRALAAGVDLRARR